MLYDNKFDCWKKTHLDFVKYLNKKINLVDSNDDYMNKGNATQVFNFSFATTKKEQQDSYLSVVKQLLKLPVYETQDKKTILYIVLEIETVLISMRDQYLKLFNCDSEIFNNAISKINEKYMSKL